MVIIKLERYYDIESYYKELKAGGLERNRDFVYHILPSRKDEIDPPLVRVGFEFLDDRYTSYYQLKWA